MSRPSPEEVTRAKLIAGPLLSWQNRRVMLAARLSLASEKTFPNTVTRQQRRRGCM